MDIIDLYKVTRSQIEHVDNTISQRIIWLIISQSFFFSGYAVLITGNPEDVILLAKQRSLILLFPISALVMNFISLIDIIAGTIYLRKLNTDFNTKKKDEAAISFPPIDGFLRLNQIKNLSALILPAVLIGIWIIILAG